MRLVPAPAPNNGPGLQGVCGHDDDLARGVNSKVVQERLGHSQISMTLDIYAHALPTMQQDAADKLGAILELL